MTLTTFLRFQKTFYRTLSTCQQTKVRIVIPTIKSRGTFTDFTGDNTVNRSEAEGAQYDITIPCLYKRNISDEERSKFGLDESINGLIYISPLSLKKSIDTYVLPKDVMESGARIIIHFFGKEVECKGIIKLEPVMVGGEEYVMAYEIRIVD